MNTALGRKLNLRPFDFGTERAFMRELIAKSNLPLRPVGKFVMEYVRTYVILIMVAIIPPLWMDPGSRDLTRAGDNPEEPDNLEGICRIPVDPSYLDVLLHV